jgi:hypothetical protein
MSLRCPCALLLYGIVEDKVHQRLAQSMLSHVNDVFTTNLDQGI